MLLLLTDIVLLSAFLALNVFYYFEKITEVTNRNVLFCFFRPYSSLQILQFLLVGG